MKTITKFLKDLFFPNPKKAFFAIARCKDCGEEVRIRINHSSDFQFAYDSANPMHCYTVKKEIIGKDCFNLMVLSLALTKNARLLFADTKGCDFVKFDKEED